MYWTPQDKRKFKVAIIGALVGVGVAVGVGLALLLGMLL